MRTTVSINNNLLDAAKRRALERRSTLGEVIEDALRLSLSTTTTPDVHVTSPLPVSTRQGGTRPGVDVADGARLRDLMDEG